MYKTLFDFYSQKEDTREQLIIVNKLLKVDSLLYTNSKYLSEHIVNDYEIPKFKLEKARLSREIKNNNRKNKMTSYVLVIVLFTVVIIAFIFYRK